MLRLFVAIGLPDTVCDQIEGLQRGLRVGRPVPRENLHLTLCFLGDQTDEAAEEAHFALSAIRAPGFDICLDGLDTFGQRAPSVVVARVAPAQGLSELERAVSRALRAAGLRFDRQRFRPHVTIARLPGNLTPADADDLQGFLGVNAAFRGWAFPVRDFALFRSQLTRKAALHTELARYPLTSSAAP